MSTNQSYLVLDSYFSTYATNNQNSTYNMDATNAILCPSSFNTLWTLRRPVRNVAKIYLKSLTLPILFPNVRSSNKSNTLTLKNTSTQTLYTVTLPDRTYKDITTLNTALTNAFKTAYPANSFTFALYNTYDSTNCYGNVSVKCLEFSTLAVVTDTILAEMLGFSSASDPLVGSFRIASGAYNLSYDHYLNMTIYTTPDHNIENQNGNAVSFHIPVPVSSDTIMFSSSNLSFDSYIQNYKGTVINTIGVVITDRFGFSLNSRNADYSMCLALEYYDDEKM